MSNVSAWIEVHANDLPDRIASMLFNCGPSHSNWLSVALTGSESNSSTAPITFSSLESALVRFEIPARMKCVSDDRPDQIVSLADVLESRRLDSETSWQEVWIPCLPAIFAREVQFVDEMAARGFESNRKRLMPGRGEGLDLKIVEADVTGKPALKPSFNPGRELAGTMDPVRFERLASAVATAVLFGRSDIGKDRVVFFDTGTSALLRQMQSGELIVPDRKRLIADTKKLVEILFQTARELGLDPGRLPGKIEDMEVGALQLAQILQESTYSQTSGTADMLEPSPPSSDKAPDGENTLDQLVLKFILQKLVGQDDFPTINDIHMLLREARQQFSREFEKQDTECRTMEEALRMLMANVESPEERIDRFREEFRALPGITGVAHVFWGWSSNPLENLEQRLKPLKSVGRNAFQVANIVFAAASGAGRLPTRYFKSRLWTAAYESAWEMLLSKRDTERAGLRGKVLWAHEKGELTYDERGPLVEVRVSDGRIPLRLQIPDRLQLVQALALKVLSSPEFGQRAASAILAATDGDTSRFSRDLKGLLQMTVTVRLRKNLTGEIEGSTVTFRNVKNSDLTVEHRWSDPSEAALKLTEGKALNRVLEKLLEVRLEELSRQMLDWSQRQSS